MKIVAEMAIFRLLSHLNRLISFATSIITRVFRKRLCIILICTSIRAMKKFREFAYIVVSYYSIPPRIKEAGKSGQVTRLFYAGCPEGRPR